MCGFMVKLRRLAFMPALPYLAAMANDPTFGDLYKAKSIIEADLDAAVDAFMTDPSLTTFQMSEGFDLDPHGAVSASPFALGMLAKPDAKPTSKRNAVRTAILLARPVK